PNNPALRNPKFATEVFESAQRPLAWLVVGRRLRQSANALFDRENPVAKRYWAELRRVGEASTKDGEVEFDEVAFPSPNFDAGYMLIAFAIENFLKGIMIAKGIVTFTGARVPKMLISHDLDKLHAAAAPAATIASHVLDSLTYMSQWRARYPLPTDVAMFWPMR